MKHPFWIAAGAGLAVLLAAMALPLWHMMAGSRPVVAGAAAPAASAPGHGTPWQIEVLPDGSSRVFGLHLGQDRLAQVEARFGETWQLALVARYDEPGALEALVDPMSAGFVQGRLVIAFDVPVAVLQAWRARSTGSQAMAGGSRRFTLRREDLAQSRGMPVGSLSFVPSVRLSAADVQQRFGEALETRTLTDQAVLLMYPVLGLSATVATGQRGVLQYVAPAEFDARLRAPLSTP